MAAKILKNRRKTLWDAALNERVPRLIQMLFSYWAQKIFLCPKSNIFACLTVLKQVALVPSWAIYPGKTGNCFVTLVYGK